MPLFRKKPVMIEAVQFESVSFAGHGLYTINFDTVADLPKWLSDAMMDGNIVPDIVEEGGVIVQTLEGRHIASPGDWIIRGVKGELYPCKPEIFAMTYDPVDEQDVEVTGVAI
jgi:hypothetical protein